MLGDRSRFSLPVHLILMVGGEEEEAVKCRAQDASQQGDLPPSIPATILQRAESLSRFNQGRRFDGSRLSQHSGKGV
jgi:hypothetical protein